MSSKKKFAFDLIYNIIATIIPLLVLQLIAYPLIGRTILAENYGLMITLYSIIQLFSATLGTGLNNVRLIKDEGIGTKGNYNIILIVEIIIVMAILGIATWIYQTVHDVFSLVLILLIGVLALINNYVDVEYRLKLNFKKILVVNIVYAIGFVIGIVLFVFTERWELVFISGQVACLLYNLKNTRILREPLKKTENFKEVLMDTGYIVFSGFCTRAISYADKIMLLPLLGGLNVSIYYTSTLLGKLVIMGMNPVNSVILSYLNKKSSVAKKTFTMYMIVGITICAVGYVFCLLISKPILEILFPQWVEAAMEYIPITTLSLCVITLCNFITPFTLKFCEMYWQVVINIVTLIIYVGFSLSFLKFFGLVGFCWGICISYFIKLLITMVVYVVKKQPDVTERNTEGEE